MNWIWPTVGNLLLLCMTAMIALDKHGGSLSFFPKQSQKFLRRDTSAITANITYEYDTYDVLLAFGDSNTQFASNPYNGGYVARLSSTYQRQMDVLNRGFSGFNSSGARAIAGSVLPKTNQAIGNAATKTSLFEHLYNVRDSAKSSIWPSRDNTFVGSTRTLQLLLLLFGTNDSIVPENSQSNTLEQYVKDMKFIISMVTDKDSDYYSASTRILVVTPPPVSDLMLQQTAAKHETQQMWYNNHTRAYAEAAIGVSKDTGVAYVDLFSAMEQAVSDDQNADKDIGQFGGYDKYLVDGVHMTAAGYNILFNLITGAINSTWPEMTPSKINWPTPVKSSA